MQGFGWTPASAFDSNLLMDIGKRLRELRKAKNLSQGDLERLAGFLLIPAKVVTGSDAKPVTLGAQRRWRRYGA